MTNLAFWIRWSWRDLRERWLLVVAIAATIGDRHRRVRGPDQHVGMAESPPTTRATARCACSTSACGCGAARPLPSGRLEAIARTIPESRVAQPRAEERLVVPTQVDASTDGQTIIVPGMVIGVDVASPTNPDRGHGGTRGPDPERRRRRRERRRARLPLRARTRVCRRPARSSCAGGTELDYVGQILTPEYFLVTNAERRPARGVPVRGVRRPARHAPGRDRQLGRG